MKTISKYIDLRITDARAFQNATESNCRIQSITERHLVHIPAIRGFFEDRCNDECVVTEDHYHFAVRPDVTSSLLLNVDQIPTFDAIFATINCGADGALFAACAEYSLMTKGE